MPEKKRDEREREDKINQLLRDKNGNIVITMEADGDKRE